MRKGKFSRIIKDAPYGHPIKRAKIFSYLIKLKLEENQTPSIKGRALVPYVISIENERGKKVTNINLNVSGQPLMSFRVKPKDIIAIVNDKAQAGNENIKIISKAKTIVQRNHSGVGSNEVASKSLQDDLIMVLGGPESEVDLIRDKLIYLATLVGSKQKE